MFATHSANHQPPQVTALFSDGVHSFKLFEGATISDLAERLDLLATWHAGAPLAVHVQLDPAPSNR